MKNEKVRGKQQDLRKAYFSGEITVGEFIREIERSKEGDRTRRAAEKKIKKISEGYELQC